MNDKDKDYLITLLTMSSPSMPEKSFGYGVKYGSNDDKTFKRRSCQNIDLSIDRTDHTTLSMNSSHALVTENKSSSELVSDWPMPHSASDESHYTQGSDLDDENSDNGGLISCLCYGFAVLGDFLCHMYSESDNSKIVHMSRCRFLDPS